MALIAYWKMDEANAADPALDSVGSRHLTPSATPPSVATGRFGNCRRWGSSNTQDLYYAGDAALRDLFADPAGTWTLSWWMACHAAGGITQPIFSLLRTASGTRLGQVTTAGSSTTWKLQALWNYAVGSNVSASDNDGLGTGNKGVWNHHAITRNGRTLTFYVNGTATYSVALAQDPIAADGTEILWFGRTFDGFSEHFLDDVSLCEVRLYDSALSAAAVESVAVEDPGADDSAPVISNVSPAAGSTIGRFEPWRGTVTDDTAFRRVMLWVKLTDSDGTERGREIIWDGTEFAAQYSSSTRTEVTPGLVFDFVARRNGGWPYSPEVFASAIDTAGNEAA